MIPADKSFRFKCEESPSILFKQTFHTAFPQLFLPDIEYNLQIAQQ